MHSKNVMEKRVYERRYWNPCPWARTAYEQCRSKAIIKRRPLAPFLATLLHCVNTEHDMRWCSNSSQENGNNFPDRMASKNAGLWASSAFGTLRAPTLISFEGFYCPHRTEPIRTKCSRVHAPRSLHFPNKTQPTRRCFSFSVSFGIIWLEASLRFSPNVPLFASSLSEFRTWGAHLCRHTQDVRPMKIRHGCGEPIGFYRLSLYRMNKIWPPPQRKRYSLANHAIYLIFIHLPYGLSRTQLTAVAYKWWIDDHSTWTDHRIHSLHRNVDVSIKGNLIH